MFKPAIDTVAIAGKEIKFHPSFKSMLNVTALSALSPMPLLFVSSHSFGSFGKASELFPYPSLSLSAVSDGSFGNASVVSGSPSPSLSKICSHCSVPELYVSIVRIFPSLQSTTPPTVVIFVMFPAVSYVYALLCKKPTLDD